MCFKKTKNEHEEVHLRLSACYAVSGLGVSSRLAARKRCTRPPVGSGIRSHLSACGGACMIFWLLGLFGNLVMGIGAGEWELMGEFGVLGR